MADRIVILTGAYHLGDNPGAFGDATWVGDRLSLPMRIEHSPADTDATFLFEVRDVDVWDPEWPGHHVVIDDEPAARLLPPFEPPPPIPSPGGVGLLRPPQIAVVTIDRNRFGDRRRFLMSIVVDRQRPGGSLIDDFVLTRIESVDWVIRPGG